MNTGGVRDIKIFSVGVVSYREVLVLEGVRKRFGRTTVLEDVSFSVLEGEVFGFVGPNGAGKSTTMKIVMGFIKPDAGRVEVFGRSMEDTEVKRRVGFLPEHPYFYTNVTGREFLKFLQLVLSVPERDFWRRVEDYAGRLQIDWALDRRLSEYSKGMLQRFGLLQAVVGEPQLLILDEPMSGLDPIGRKLVADLIADMKERGRTVLFSTHILPDVERLCDRACVIINGRVTDLLEGEELSELESLFMERTRELGIREVL